MEVLTPEIFCDLAGISINDRFCINKLYAGQSFTRLGWQKLLIGKFSIPNKIQQEVIVVEPTYSKKK